MQVDQEEGVQKSQAEQQNQADEETENPGTETKVCIQYWHFLPSILTFTDSASWKTWDCV